MVDNYDSFTYNLVHYLEKINLEVVVKRNDEVSIDEIQRIAPSHIVISPGPCDPDSAGLTLQLIKYFHDKLPIFGVCLGHQAIGQAFGARVIKAKQVMHGKASAIYHNNQGVFDGLPQGFLATRYHSLVLNKESLPSCLEVTAWTKDEAGDVDVVMGIRHKCKRIEGVQFHPESVLSENGVQLLQRFMNESKP